MVDFSAIQRARQLLPKHIQLTPVLRSSQLDNWLGHRILFKAESLQTTGSFKLRGASHFVAHHATPATKRLIANSSGNHAQAVAYVARQRGLAASIYSNRAISQVKAAATQHYGAQLALFDTRPQADVAVAEAAKQAETLWVPPFDHPDIITGQGTLAAEALQQTGDIDAVIAPCGGGGLLSGTLIATRHLQPRAQVLGAEPLAANDAALSLRKGKIQRLSQAPDTLADGAATPSVGEHNFPYLQQLDDFYEVPEAAIAYWTQWLQHLLKLHVEPTSALSMHGACAWLARQRQPKTLLVLLTGGNIDHVKMQQIWQHDHLQQPPCIDIAQV